MTINLTKPSEGAVGWTGVITQNWTDIENAINAGAPRKWIDGCRPVYLTSTTVQIRSGKARDNADSALITKASDSTIDLAANGALGVERKQLTGTVAGSGGNTITGTSTLFLSEFGTRPLTGTLVTGGGSSTTVSGTETRFLEELRIGDLIGNSTDGFREVSSITSSTSLTVTSAVSITSSIATAIEYPTIAGGSITNCHVTAIASNTSLTAARTQGSYSNQTAYAGERLTGGSVTHHLYLWVSDTTAFASTQRTTPLGSSLGSNFRVVGSIMWDQTAIVPFTVIGEGFRRLVSIDVDNGASGTTLLAAGSEVSWTTLDGSVPFPKGAESFFGYCAANSTGGWASFRAQLGQSQTGPSSVLLASSASYVDTPTVVPVGPSGGCQYRNQQAGGSTYLFVQGYWWEAF